MQEFFERRGVLPVPLCFKIHEKLAFVNIPAVNFFCHLIYAPFGLVRGETAAEMTLKKAGGLFAQRRLPVLQRVVKVEYNA